MSAGTAVDELTGRELDAAVAVEVMGYEVVRRRFTGKPERSSAPHYSTDIAAAWDVVWQVTAYKSASDDPACQERPPDFELWKEGGTDVYEAKFGGCEAEACSAPEAICRAALKAVRE
jgi:hypothetical protein